jgi:hypothetical protein
MSIVYFFSNETKNEFVYANNIGTYIMEIKNIVETVCQKKKWEVSDKVVIIQLDGKRMTSYCYQNKIFSVDYKNNPKYEWIEIETNEHEICNKDESMCFEEYTAEYDYDEYNFEEIEYDRYDDRYDYNDGYEDESFECCDIY